MDRLRARGPLLGGGPGAPGPLRRGPADALHGRLQRWPRGGGAVSAAGEAHAASLGSPVDHRHPFWKIDDQSKQMPSSSNQPNLKRTPMRATRWIQ